MKKLLLLLALAVLLQGAAFADSLPPCQPGTLTSIANTSCSIGDINFTFGSPDPTPSPVTFTPDLTNVGFVLTGPVTITNTSIFDRLLGDVNLPFVADTSNGQPLILGFVSSVSGQGPNDDSELCSTDVARFECIFGGPGGQFAVPLSEASGELLAFMIGPEHELGSETFTSGSFKLIETPEPSSLLLVAAGLIGFAKRAQKFFARP